MESYIFPANKLRTLIGQAIPEELAVFGNEVPAPRFLYVPATHYRALNPDNMLIVGIRGAGKSFWWTALQSENHRRLIAEYLPKAEVKDATRISPGFGSKPDPEHYPGKDSLLLLLKDYEARDIWRAIVVWCVLDEREQRPTSWKDRIEWVKADPERLETKLYEVDHILHRQGLKHLILFDALDLVADDWSTARRLLKGLLQVLLEFRSSQAIRPKAFVRPDMLEDPVVAAFPDASKILNNKVELIWPSIELYSLLWQYLGNELEWGEVFRMGCKDGFQQTWQQKDEVWIIPSAMRTNMELQRSIFHAMAGPWMGLDKRRGFPYTWLPNHLADARRQTSPRSFLAALRKAAEESKSQQRTHDYAFHYEGIKRGVQEASRIRVREMQEDYPWVQGLMEPLRGLSVPCSFDKIAELWRNTDTLGKLRKKGSDQSVRLPPQHLEEGPEGVRRDLGELAVFQTMDDGRVNLPDVYRVGYGLGRRGGVKAIRKG